jgi:hypothetical protein
MGSDKDRNIDQGERTGNEPSPEEILATGSSSTDLDSALARPARRGRGLSSTMLLVAGVLLAAVFVGGLLLGRTTAPDTGAAFPGGGTLPGGGTFPGGGTGPGAGNVPGFGDGGFTAGTVTRIDGDTIFVQTADGQTIEVRTNTDTDIQVTAEGSIDDLAEGETVVVQGDASDDGAIEASSVVEGGLGLGGGFPGSAGGNG